MPTAMEWTGEFGAGVIWRARTRKCVRRVEAQVALIGDCSSSEASWLCVEERAEGRAPSLVSKQAVKKLRHNREKLEARGMMLCKLEVACPEFGPVSSQQGDILGRNGKIFGGNSPRRGVSITTSWREYPVTGRACQGPICGLI